MTRVMTLTILGSGCSTGVPRADGYWGACDPQNPKNRRSRCSAWVSLYDPATPERSTSVIIDTAPDFREQMIRASVPHIDAVLWTHDHADQTHGLDDIRAFTFGRGPIDAHMDPPTHDSLYSRFNYAFTGKHGYPPVYKDHIIPPHGVPWTISGEGGELPVITFDQEHGPIRSVGYRLGDVAYSSDISDLPEESFSALQGLKLWVVDAMRYKPHSTHAHLELALAWIERVRPQRAILTNLHQDMDYDILCSQVPAYVDVAYDQMAINIDMS